MERTRKGAHGAADTGHGQRMSGSAHAKQAASPNGARAAGAKRRPGARNEVTPRAAESRAQTRISCARPVAKTPEAAPAARVHHGLDFLKLSVWLDRVGDRFSDFLGHLKRLKESMQETEDVESLPIGFDRHDAQFNLCRRGTARFPYRLVAGDIVLLFADRRGDSNMPTARLEIGSITSQTRLLEAVEDVHQLFASLYTVILKENVSEIHMAADFIGTALHDLDIQNMEKWITKGIHFGVYHEHRTLTGVTLGKGDLMLRIYDKIRELRRAEHKQDVFSRLWGVSNYDDLPVTRVEYQLRRPVLREFFQKETGGNSDDPTCEMTNFHFLMKSLKSLWKYCVEDWARFCATVVDRKNKHQSRAVLSYFWVRVQAVEWTNLLHLKRGRVQAHKDINKLIKQASGVLMSISSFFLHDEDFDDKGIVKKIIDLSEFVISNEVSLQYNQDEYEFSRRMKRKRNSVFTSIGDDDDIYTIEEFQLRYIEV